MQPHQIQHTFHVNLRKSAAAVKKANLMPSDASWPVILKIGKPQCYTSPHHMARHIKVTCNCTRAFVQDKNCCNFFFTTEQEHLCRTKIAVIFFYNWARALVQDKNCCIFFLQLSESTCAGQKLLYFFFTTEREHLCRTKVAVIFFYNWARALVQDKSCCNFFYNWARALVQDKSCCNFFYNWARALVQDKSCCKLFYNWARALVQDKGRCRKFTIKQEHLCRTKIAVHFLQLNKSACAGRK